LKRTAHYEEECRGVFSVPLYDAKACRAIVERVKRLDDWSAAQVRFVVGPTEFVTTERADTRLARILNSAYTRELYDRFDERMNELIKPLIKRIFGVSLHQHSGTQILHYPPGGHYVPHQDAVSDMLYRYFTVVCYLNDDFEGGHTWFPSLNHSVVPQVGKAVLFPSRFYHCAQPVIRGEKFVIVSWVDGPLPLKWI
jgi:hypothetical protein